MMTLKTFLVSSGWISLVTVLFIVLFFVSVVRIKKYKRNIGRLEAEISDQLSLVENLKTAHDRRLEEISEKHASEKAQIDTLHKAELRRVKEQVETQIEALNTMDEKELLVNNTRFLENLHGQFEDISDVLRHEGSIKRIECSLDGIIQKFKDSYDNLGINTIVEKLDNIVEELSVVNGKLDRIDEKIANIYDELDNIDSDNSCEYNQSDIDDIRSLLSNGFNELGESISDVSNKLGDSYDYGTIAYDVSEIKSAIDAINDRIE